MADLKLNKVIKRFGDVQTIHGVDLDIKHGEFVVFVGPSGCGKSTLLRMIAGLETISDGEVIIDGLTVNDVSPSDRGIAMVFQSYALYPHMTVKENMSFGLRLAKKPKEEIEQRVAEAARVLKLEHLLDRLPKQLSGGQRQRVAIGRTIVRNPKVFLFDEPLSNLDAELRVQMRVEISKLHEQLGNTMIYVTHDQVEAMTMADKIVVLRDGRVEQVGAPLELYHNPVNQFVAGFIGSPRMNFLNAKVLQMDGNKVSLELTGGEQFSMTLDRPVSVGDVLLMGIRPEHLEVDTSGDVNISLKVDVVEALGGTTFAYTQYAGEDQVVVVTDGSHIIPRGKTITASFNLEHVHLFDTNTATSLLQQQKAPVVAKILSAA
ncbi:ABC transporter ATP-binding protein [Tolumonas osonensis]|uniref:Multiple sugar transport system ATP-binding protein/lactose/L-arabinose transport system ATP-binding protein n=1 Tax=Tolumonas osonensis TaxID=675874 RepID=A0A841GKA1_9GAMM|nr:sn-glycerol-3-phosphate ABC transporter ATP-binding protein UgpC [Tolumonas osonensis]MBB6055755.1 multiple sugar transport system ATP-binding protein/lactose/L-arabinose transport system ATP-binding protein [Tolumonas osonensis]